MQTICPKTSSDKKIWRKKNIEDALHRKLKILLFGIHLIHAKKVLNPSYSDIE